MSLGCPRVAFLKDLITNAAQAADAGARDPTATGSLIFLVHCAPDGSCSKSVRKLTRGLKLEADEPCTLNMIKSTLGAVQVKLLLLSGATCANSATMAGPSIFANGQRFRVALQRAGAPTLADPRNLRQLHAELCDLRAAMLEAAAAWFPFPAAVTEAAARASIARPAADSHRLSDELAEKSPIVAGTTVLSLWERLTDSFLSPTAPTMRVAVAGVVVATAIAVAGKQLQRSRRSP